MNSAKIQTNKNAFRFGTHICWNAHLRQTQYSNWCNSLGMTVVKARLWYGRVLGLVSMRVMPVCKRRSFWSVNFSTSLGRTLYLSCLSCDFCLLSFLFRVFFTLFMFEASVWHLSKGHSLCFFAQRSICYYWAFVRAAFLLGYFWSTVIFGFEWKFMNFFIDGSWKSYLFSSKRRNKYWIEWGMMKWWLMTARDSPTRRLEWRHDMKSRWFPSNSLPGHCANSQRTFIAPPRRHKTFRKRFLMKEALSIIHELTLHRKRKRGESTWIRPSKIEASEVQWRFKSRLTSEIQVDFQIAQISIVETTSKAQQTNQKTKGKKMYSTTVGILGCISRYSDFDKSLDKKIRSASMNTQISGK